MKEFKNIDINDNIYQKDTEDKLLRIITVKNLFKTTDGIHVNYRNTISNLYGRGTNQDLFIKNEDFDKTMVERNRKRMNPRAVDHRRIFYHFTTEK